jgi:endonuclease/exonuclease/phosphatase (EEP) superfamily protein YafD
MSGAKAALDRSVVVLSVLALLASACVLLARTWWFFELFSHFRVQLLAGLLVLLLTALVLRRRAMAVALGIATLIAGLPIRDYVVPMNHGEASQRAEIRIITANVLVANRDPAGLLDVLQSGDPDVFVIVEFTDRFADALKVLEDTYPHAVLAPARGAFGIALYSRWPLRNQHVFELAGTSAIHAELLSGNDRVHVIAAHLLPPMTSTMAATRNAQLRGLGDFVGTLSGPIVVAGDLNITPYSPYFVDFTERSGLRSALRGFGPSYTWPTFMPILGIPIDHVLVSDDLEIANYARAAALGSDHFPVVVDMNHRPMSLD